MDTEHYADVRLVENYVDQVMQYVTAERSTKMRLAAELVRHIGEAARGKDAEAVLEQMGPPRELAEQVAAALPMEKRGAMRRLVQVRTDDIHPGQEYTSPITIFGLPLLHINHTPGGQNGGKPRVARGIVAIGDIAVGGIAIGGVALGGIAIGGLSIGLAALGGLGVGLLLALGGAAISGGLAIGGLAISVMYAMGGLAVAGRIALGGAAYATVAIGGTATGQYTFITGGGEFSSGDISALQLRSLILSGYPNIPAWVLQFFTFIVT